MVDLFASVGRALQGAFAPLTPIFGGQYDPKTDIGKPPVYPAYNIHTYLNAYNTNATIYTIVSYIVQKFGNVPRYMYEIEDAKTDQTLKYMLRQREIKLSEIKKLAQKAYGQEAVPPSLLTPEGRMSRLTYRPNEHQGQDSYYAHAYLYYELTGEAFIYLNRGLTPEDEAKMSDDEVAKTPVREKIVLPTQFVTVTPSSRDINQILNYRFEYSPGLFRTIRTVDMIHWKKPNPLYDGSTGLHLRGHAPLSAGLKLLTQDNSATDAAVSMQQNQGAKGMFVAEAPSPPTPQQSSDIRSQLDTHINGTGNKGRVGFLGGPKFNYFDMGQSAVDLQLGQSQQTVFIRLCNLFGVPPAIFLTETTYENLQQAGKSLLTNKILPACCSLRDEENRVLSLAFGVDPTKYTTDIDATLIPELAEDMGKLATQLSISDWKTLNEKREAMGDEPMDNPNMDLILIGNNKVSLDDQIVTDGLGNAGGMGLSNDDGLQGEETDQPGQAGNLQNANA